jgi:acyl-homoserine lactone acylase PvdQ
MNFFTALLISKMNRFLLLFFLPVAAFAQKFSPQEIANWKQEAQQVTIIRDNWGIPHVYGKTDADAVFGLMYAQCQDDFNRVEMNYIEKLGRMSEIRGDSSLYADLLIRMIIDSADAVSDYNKAEPWMKKLLNAFADGINYFLYKNPDLEPVLLHRFKPWYPLLWTDGSIGAISLGGLTEKDLRDFYGGNYTLTGFWKKPTEPDDDEPFTGSNGFAFSPSITASGNAMLYINPHVTFYFRPEVHMVSDEGLNAYGAVTWGQFFIYQGFNEHCGWMHTSSAVDVSDLYSEKVSRKNGAWVYAYDRSFKKVTVRNITLHYREKNRIVSRTFATLYTHHGPVMAKAKGQWISVRSHNRSMNGLEQCWQRTKSRSFEEFKKVMGLLSNTSNNTVYADAEGNIAYWHGNYIPVRDPKFNWSNPVDGSTSATEWKGLHTVDQSVHVYNPPNGWLQNCNSTPFTAAGKNSPRKVDYPAYMAPDAENFRGVNAVRVLDRERSYTLDKVIAAGYDTYLAAFEDLVPALVKAFEHHVPPSDSLYNLLDGPIKTLKQWDLRSAESSVATTLAIEWGQNLLQTIRNTDAGVPGAGFVEKTRAFATKATPTELFQPLIMTVNALKNKFGTWKMPLGEINRFQRISGLINQQFSDDQPSYPVGFVSSLWGMLPSYNSREFPGTKKRYGVDGNSFVCAVEFGKRVKARSLLAGGESGVPGSRHFFDQGLLYSKGQFKDVLFYKEDVLHHMEKQYHPGE